MRMPRVNVYLPADLAEAAKAADLNMSQLTQDAVRAALQRKALADWLDSLHELPRPEAEVTTEQILQAIDDSRDEFEARWDDRE
jgi:post-segregation antitoxin (ccd killing protein)